MSPNPLVNIPALRALAGFFGLTRSPTNSPIRGLPQLIGGLVQNDTDVRDVINGIVAAVDAGAGGPTTYHAAVFAGSPSNVTLSDAEAISDVIFLTGTPGDDLHTLTLPLVSGGFVSRPQGTRMVLFNTTAGTITMTDPWGNAAPLLAGTLYDCLWVPSLTAIYPIARGPSLSRALDAEMSKTRGSIIMRSASGWIALGPGNAGQVLTSQGAGADPHWA